MSKKRLRRQKLNPKPQKTALLMSLPARQLFQRYFNEICPDGIVCHNCEQRIKPEIVGKEDVFARCPECRSLLLAGNPMQMYLIRRQLGEKLREEYIKKQKND